VVIILDIFFDDAITCHLNGLLPCGSESDAFESPDSLESNITNHHRKY